MDFQQPGSVQQGLFARFLRRVALFATLATLSGGAKSMDLTAVPGRFQRHGESDIELKFLARHQTGIF